MASAMKLEGIAIELLIEQSPEATKEQVANPKAENEDLSLNAKTRYFEFSEGIRKGVIVPLLNGVHPDLPKAEVKQMQVATGKTGELFKEKEFIPVRVMAVKAFVDGDKKWKEYIERPSSMIDPITRRLQADLRGYGWKDGEAQAKPGEEVTRTGFFKVEKEKLEAALQESGLEGGVFLEKLRVNNGYRGPVAWIKRTERD